jgi:hypothetical protein
MGVTTRKNIPPQPNNLITKHIEIVPPLFFHGEFVTHHNPFRIIYKIMRWLVRNKYYWFISGILWKFCCITSRIEFANLISIGTLIIKGGIEGYIFFGMIYILLFVVSFLAFLRGYY